MRKIRIKRISIVKISGRKAGKIATQVNYAIRLNA